MPLLRSCWAFLPTILLSCQLRLCESQDSMIFSQRDYPRSGPNRRTHEPYRHSISEPIDPPLRITPRPATCPPRVVQEVCNPQGVLNFARTGLKRIGDGFVESADARELILDGNEISEVSPLAFAKLKRLQAVSLSGNRIPIAKLLWFSRHDSLQKVTIDDNEYAGNKTVLNQMYEALPVLEQLFLRRNRITHFDVSLKVYTPRLTHLDLSGNALSVLEAQLPEKLSHLRLDDNAISDFKKNLLPYALQDLSVSGNKIAELCGASCNDDLKLSLDGMIWLTRLNVSGNRISELSADAFASTENLSSLDLSANEIKMIPVDTFNGLSALQELQLSRNRLTSVPNLCTLNNLRSLDLSGNWIVELSSKSFCNVAHLQTLNLANNHILNVPGDDFGNLYALQTFDLSGNSIDKLPIELIRTARSLQMLSLKGNMIANIDNLFSVNQINLHELRLEDNPLLSFSVSYMPGLKIHLKELKSMEEMEEETANTTAATQTAKKEESAEEYDDDF